MRRIGQIETDFFYFFLKICAFATKKNVLICPISPIRSPNVSQLKLGMIHISK